MKNTERHIDGPNGKEKACIICKKFKPLDLFTAEKRSSDGKSARCKDCTNTVARANYDYDKSKQEHEKYYSTLKGFLERKIYMAKKLSKQKGRKFDIDLEFVIELYHKQNGLCAITGIKMTHDASYNDGIAKPYQVSMDRINCDIGYIKSNVRLVCTIVNYALNKFGEQIFDHVMTKIGDLYG